MRIAEPMAEAFNTEGARGWGIRSTKPIRRRTFILEFLGEVISRKEFKRRERKTPEVVCSSLPCLIHRLFILMCM